jgi:O-antigen ligase
MSYVLLFSGTVVVLLGFIQYFFYPSLRNLYYLGWDEHLYRLFSSFLDPNFAGAFFALFFIYTLNFIRDFLNKNEKIKFILTSFIAFLTFIALYLTYSRSALIMLLAGIVVYLFLIKKKKFIFLILLSVILLILVLPKTFETEGTNFLRATSSDARISTAKEALTVIQTNPVYGVGFNAYRFAEQKLGLINGPDWQTTHGGAGTDNSFLFVLATTGIVGLIAFLHLLYKIFFLGRLNVGKNKFALVLIPSLAGLIIGSLFINSLFYVFILEWIWIMTAFAEKF